MGRLDQPAHHVAAKFGDQRLALARDIDHRALAQRGGEDLALGLERLDLGRDQALLIFAEIEEAEPQQRQRQRR